MPLAGLFEHDSALGRWRMARWTTRLPLSAHVIELWDLESHGAYTRERILPRTHFDLLINLGESPHRVWLPEGRANEYRAAWVSGLQDRFLDVESPPDCRLMGVTLTPTGARTVLGIPAAEFRNRVTDLRDVVGPEEMRVREQLADAGSVEARFHALESWLMARTHRGETAQPAIDVALERLFASKGRCRVGHLARELGMSQKHLIHLFRDQVGLPPKTFARVVRFNALVQHLRTQASVDLTETAHYFHYFDYPHFARECREFTGSSPTEFLRSRGPDGDTVIVE